MRLSVIIPVYNERDTVEDVVRSVEVVDVGFEKEIIIVDDGSTDGTQQRLKKLKHKVIYQLNNRGKGAAIRRGFTEASGDIILIQDADFEYDPANYPELLGPILQGKADVVYGSRFITHHPRRILYHHHYIANKFLTFCSNLFSNLNISDMETCYKVFSSKALKSIMPCLSSNRFGIEVELTAEIAKHHLRVYEVGVSYNGRTYEEGKKIGWKDGVAALGHLFWFNLIRPHR